MLTFSCSSNLPSGPCTSPRLIARPSPSWPAHCPNPAQSAFLICEQGALHYTIWAGGTPQDADVVSPCQ